MFNAISLPVILITRNTQNTQIQFSISDLSHIFYQCLNLKRSSYSLKDLRTEWHVPLYLRKSLASILQLHLSVLVHGSIYVKILASNTSTTSDGLVATNLFLHLFLQNVVGHLHWRKQPTANT